MNAPQETGRADPQLPAAPTESAAERWIAEQLAADRSTGGDEFAGYWATDRPAKRARGRGPASDDTTAGPGPGPASTELTARPGPEQVRTGPPDRTAGGRTDTGEPARRAGPPAEGVRSRPPGGDQRPADTRPQTDHAGNDALSGWSAGRPGTDERFAGYWVRERPGGPERAGRDEPTEVFGPLDVGAWSRDGTAAPAHPRGRQRAEPSRELPDDRTPTGPGRGGGGGSGEPPKRGGDGRPERRRRSFGDRVRTFLRGIGQTFLTLGLVLLLLAGYEVWFTELLNHRTQKDLTTALQKRWDTGDDPTVGAVPTRPGEKVRGIPLGDGFALLYIPDFGTDYVFTVVEGTGVDQLNEGPGHYVGTPLPGAVGNVAIAGHRVGKGSPFLNVDKLRAGSAIVIRTKSYWYTYRVVGQPGGDADAVSALGFPGREIVAPSDVGVIAPVPDRPGATPTRRLLTLTTCHPKFTARQRMVVHAELDGAPFPVGKGNPPSLTGA